MSTLHYSRQRAVGLRSAPTRSMASAPSGRRWLHRPRGRSRRPRRRVRIGQVADRLRRAGSPSDRGVDSGGTAIRLEGVELLTMNRRGRAALRGSRVAYIPQEPMSNLDPSFTIGAQLIEPMVAVRGMSKAAARTRAVTLLTEVGIVDLDFARCARIRTRSPAEWRNACSSPGRSRVTPSCSSPMPTTALDVTVQADVLARCCAACRRIVGWVFSW